MINCGIVAILDNSERGQEMTINTNFFSGIESNLYHTLLPIDPDPDFIHGLGSRLSKRPSISVERPYNHMLGAITIGAGLVTGAFLIWGLRKVFTLIKA